MGRNMNALDQAFIKAFAKDRTATQRRRTSTNPAPAVPKATVQPPDAGVESMELALHDLYQQGQRLRIDRPVSSEGTMSSPHMLLPSVEQVDTYDAEAIGRAPASHFIVEDRLEPLDALLVNDHQAAVGGDGDASAANTLPTDAETADDSQETKLNVVTHTEVVADRDVPTLAFEAEVDADGVAGAYTQSLPHPAAPDVRHDGQSAADEDASEEDVPAEDASGADKSGDRQSDDEPLVLLAVPENPLPELETEEIGCLTACGGTDVAVALTTLELGTLDIDPTLLEWPVQGPADSPELGDEALTVPDVTLASDLPATTEAEDPAADLHNDVAMDAVPPACEEPTPATIPHAEQALVEQPPATDPFQSQSALAPFTPAWEVDAFRWPEICAQLDEASEWKLKQSGDELHVATQDGLKVLAVTSGARHEGRTTLTPGARTQHRPGRQPRGPAGRRCGQPGTGPPVGTRVTLRLARGPAPAATTIGSGGGVRRRPDYAVPDDRSVG